MTALKNMMTLTEAADELGVFPASLRQAIKQKRLKAQKMGERLWLVSSSEIERYRSVRKKTGRTRKKIEINS